MIFFLYPTKDTTIYKKKELRLLNTGRDEILEVSNFKDEVTGHEISRILIEFDLDTIVKNKLVAPKYYLNFKITESSELRSGGKLYVFPLAESWDEGVGRWSDSEVDYEGASWENRTASATKWTTSPLEDSTGGGTWYDTQEDSDGKQQDIVCMFEFKGMFSDVKLDVTDIVNYWLDGVIDNNGFIAMFLPSDGDKMGKLKFFSKDTNTIYSPHLQVVHEDYYFNPCSTYEVELLTCGTNTTLDTLDSGTLDSGTLVSGTLDSGTLDSGSVGVYTEVELEELDYETSNVKRQQTPTQLIADDIVIFPKGIRSEYKSGDRIRVPVGVREKYPKKTFSNKSDYDSFQFVTHPMYFSVRDAETEEVVIDFSSYSRISCDSRGHYYNFDFGCLQPGRFYKFLLKLDRDSTSCVVEDTKTFVVKI